jgi:hypothetical protein
MGSDDQRERKSVIDDEKMQTYLRGPTSRSGPSGPGCCIAILSHRVLGHRSVSALKLELRIYAAAMTRPARMLLTALF